ncbi:hypothetical protein Y032_0005g2516 [Ancylostoma ceylanicum]|nr:hypothetical protein Y032_0005g2516 [Ancylostoma ceylanicum]
MATVRIGLKQVSNGNNSPSLTILQAKKEKSDAKKRLVPVTISSCDKENRETQAKVEIESAFTQTDVLAIKDEQPITEEDLLCDEPSSSYWRGMAEKFEKEIDKELENSFNVGFVYVTALHQY